MRSQDDQFERDYDKAVGKLKEIIRNSQIIKKAIEEKLNEDELEKLIVLMRELMPETLRDLVEVHYFLQKNGYNDNAAKTKNDLWSKEQEPK